MAPRQSPIVAAMDGRSKGASPKYQSYLQFVPFTTTEMTGRIFDRKRPLKPKQVWAIRVHFELAENHLSERQQASRLQPSNDRHSQCHGVEPNQRARLHSGEKVPDTGTPTDLKGAEATIQKSIKDESVVGPEHFLAGPVSSASAYPNPTICPHGPRLDRAHRLRGLFIRRTFDAAHEGDTDLQG